MKKAVRMVIALALTMALLAMAGCSGKPSQSEMLLPEGVKCNMTAEELEQVMKEKHGLETELELFDEMDKEKGEDYEINYPWKLLSKYDVEMEVNIDGKSSEIRNISYIFKEEDQTEKNYEIIKEWMLEKYGEPKDILDNGTIKWSNYQHIPQSKQLEEDGIDLMHFLTLEYEMKIRMYS